MYSPTLSKAGSVMLVLPFLRKVRVVDGLSTMLVIVSATLPATVSWPPIKIDERVSETEHVLVTSMAGFVAIPQPWSWLEALADWSVLMLSVPATLTELTCGPAVCGGM